MTNCVWCVVGEIVERRGPPLGELWRPHLSPGTTVYLSSLRDAWWPFRSARKDRHIELIFKHEPSHEYTRIFERYSNVADWRVEFVCEPVIVERLRKSDWPGFLLQDWDFVAPRNLRSANSVRQLLGVLRKIHQGNPAWVRRLEQKCGEAFLRFNRIAEFLGRAGAHEWSWIFSEISNKLKALDDESAVALYIELLHNRYGSFRDFYCALNRQPIDTSTDFRKLFTDAATAITNVRWLRQHDVDRRDLDGPLPN